MPKQDFATRAISVLQDYCDTKCSGNVRKMKIKLGMNPDMPYLNRWLGCLKDKKDSRMPRLDSIGPVLDKIGAVIVVPWEEAAAPASAGDMDAVTKEMAKALKDGQEQLQKLEAQLKEMEQYKIKWETVLELEKVRNPPTQSAQEKKASNAG